MSSLIKGTVTLTDETTHSFVAGPRERIKAERVLGVNAAEMRDGKVGESYLVFLIFESLKRTESIKDDIDFDSFIDELLFDYEVDVDPESPTPLEQ